MTGVDTPDLAGDGCLRPRVTLGAISLFRLQVYATTGIVMEDAKDPKSLTWLGSSRRIIRAFPLIVRKFVGQALWEAQKGDKHRDAKPLRGFGGSSVLEIVEDHDGDTYRAVYTVRFADVVYVLHAFKKKSKSGIATPKKEVDLIRQRLKQAELLHKERKP